MIQSKICSMVVEVYFKEIDGVKVSVYFLNKVLVFLSVSSLPINILTN
jgi:hypothetical protein